MAYAYSEFPNSDYHKVDYHEMFKLYCDVRDKYAGTLDEIAKLNTKLDKYMQDKNSEIDNWMDVQRAYINSTINGKTEELYQRLYTLLNEKMVEHIQQVTRQMDSFTATVSANINSMQDEIRYMKEDISKFENRVNAKLNEHISTNNNNYRYFAEQYRELDSHIRESINNINTKLEADIDYIKNRLPAIDNKTFKFYWNLLSTVQGMTAKEWYDYVVMTCEDWNNSKITCSEWFTRSKKLTGYDSYMSLMFSPFTGELTSLAQIVTEIWSNMKIGAITAGEYDCQEWTAQEIDQLRESVSAYDWAGDVFFKRFDCRTRKEE